MTLIPKGGLSQRKRPSFTTQKAVFCNAKHGLLYYVCQYVGYQIVTLRSVIHSGHNLDIILFLGRIAYAKDYADVDTVDD